jgi:hypothetical protein
MHPSLERASSSAFLNLCRHSHGVISSLHAVRAHLSEPDASNGFVLTTPRLDIETKDFAKPFLQVLRPLFRIATSGRKQYESSEK